MGLLEYQKRSNPSASGDAIQYRTDGTAINTADYVAPIPNGDEVINVTGAGVYTLTPPNEDSILAIITNPKEVRVRFNALPNITTGTLYIGNQGILLESPEEIEQINMYIAEAGAVFVQYFK